MGKGKRESKQLQLLAEAVPAIARRSVAVPTKMFGTVSTYDPDGGIVNVVVDGDLDTSPITNATGRAPQPGERVVIDFYPPHGAVVSGFLDPDRSTLTAARAWASGATAIGVAGTTIALASESYDYGGNFAASAYACPRAGLLDVRGAMSITSTTGQRYLLSVEVNGVERSRGSDLTNFGAVNQVLGLVVTDTLAVAAGDSVTLRALRVGGANVNCATGEFLTFLACRMVAG